MATGKTIDLLDRRDAEPVATWLKAHPGAAVICRDLTRAYAQAAREAAPDAIQCADRWHLWQVRREALIDRVGVRDIRRRPVVAGR